MTAGARMIGVNQDGNIAESMCLDLGWVGVMKDQGFEDRVADVGGPLESCSAVVTAAGTTAVSTTRSFPTGIVSGWAWRATVPASRR